MLVKPTIIMLDNVDSFTYNLVDQFLRLNYKVKTFRNHLEASLIYKALTSEEKAILVLSPGPGIPSVAGCMPELISQCRGQFPILGICLGHQAIVESYGGYVDRSAQVLHGKSSSLYFSQSHPIFDGLKSGFSVARYHSLVATYLPDSLLELATSDDLVMAVINEEDKVCGLQFHPESILTTDGELLLKNILKWMVT